jgi:FdhD protein
MCTPTFLKEFAFGYLYTSGIIKKCGIPIVLSRGALTHQTVLMAREMGVTVIGFARGDSLTIYSHNERVTVD